VRFTRHIPNFFTSLNLLCGCVGIVYTTNGDIDSALYFVLLGAFFDFLDGFTARILKVFSEVGKELDSLADMVTFGVLPSFVLFESLRQVGEHKYLPYVAFSIAIFSALRLAKFNVDTLQRDVFIGLPTPACALFLTGLPYLKNFGLSSLIGTTSFLIAVIAVFSLMMVLPIKFVAMKFKSKSFRGNEVRLILLAGALLLLAALGIPSTSVVVIWYIIVSIVSRHFQRRIVSIY